MADFDTLVLANMAWAFATAGWPDAQLFTTLARASERCIADCNIQNLTNTASMSDCNLKDLANEQRLHFRMTLWALSRQGRLRDAWSLFEQTKHTGISFSPHCFEALLLECKQRGFSEHTISLLKALEGAKESKHAELGFGVAAKHVAAMHLATINEILLCQPQMTHTFVDGHCSCNDWWSLQSRLTSADQTIAVAVQREQEVGAAWAKTKRKVAKYAASTAAKEEQHLDTVEDRRSNIVKLMAAAAVEEPQLIPNGLSILVYGPGGDPGITIFWAGAARLAKKKLQHAQK